jgi:hypothetical protein
MIIAISWDGETWQIHSRAACKLRQYVVSKAQKIKKKNSSC